MSVVLTKSRFSNALRCYASYALNRLGSALFRTPYTLHRTPYTVHHTPLFVSVEPSAVCQLRCPACPVGLAFGNKCAEVYMSMDLWERVLSQIKDSAWVVQFYFQGEPLLNKDLPLMIREAHDAGLYTIVSTNAQAMTPELAKALVAAGLDRIIISMDGLTQETYEAYRVGGSLDQCKAAIRWLQKVGVQLEQRGDLEGSIPLSLRIVRHPCRYARQCSLAEDEQTRSHIEISAV